MEFDTMIHDNIKMFAQTTDIMLADRAYDEILSWIATNHTKLQKDSTFFNEVYGEILPDQSACYIVVGVFKDFISQKYNYDSVTRELVNKGNTVNAQRRDNSNKKSTNRRNRSTMRKKLNL